ncbi:hypothetical protein [Enterovibrio norvegicus]|uniref:Uncharacterized protein n=2 Tax=Enterovibrio norvegicus TaxID=188144 RepID=A0A2N7LER0_9GAMM|nr:hypothetical protein [Enterovibrio norvegicus]MCC4799349.1 hypothetical protein [Enterovibrio norvegicus]OEE62553.1 hypothetical protein A1OS_02475 [Enterovibrio norvegicus]OEF51235.1 hypothetical protein A1OW_10000 [Enterovibrio norvegicus]OEF59043.1 hypothetical protein A1OU_12930 [Enterovibrio norvegicus]PMH64223.1 hypothetical protein BCU62_01480 [Enterovibrio norvegicus]
MDLKVGRKTLLDPDAVEYQWIRTLASDGSTDEMINHSIRRCLGGNEDTADKIRRVALGIAPMAELLRSLPTHY